MPRKNSEDVIALDEAPEGAEVLAMEPMHKVHDAAAEQAAPANPVSGLIMIRHLESGEELEVTEANFIKNQGYWDSRGFRRVDSDGRTTLTPPGPKYTHHRGTGFVAE